MTSLASLGHDIWIACLAVGFGASVTYANVQGNKPEPALVQAAEFHMAERLCKPHDGLESVLVIPGPKDEYVATVTIWARCADNVRIRAEQPRLFTPRLIADAPL